MAPGWKPQEPKPATPPAARPSSAGVLKVTLVEGRAPRRRQGRHVRPFAVLQLLDQYDNPHGKPQKSKTIKKTLVPQWKQSFQFPLPATVVGFKLRVVVQDQDRGLFGAKPATNLGTAYLSMAMLAPGTVQDNWFKLERVGDMQRVSAPSAEAGVAKREAENAAAGLPPGVDIAALDNQPDKPPNELHVVLMRASGLKVMDKSLFGRGSSDPYVTLSCDGETSKSTIKRKELNPVWLETFKFPAFDSKTSLKLTVFDHDDLGKDDFMGRVNIRAAKESDIPDFKGSDLGRFPLVHIKMRDLKDKALKRMTLKLEGESGRADEDRGEIEFFAAWRTNGKLMVDLPASVLQLTKQPERHADEAPNELIVVVIRATRLLAMDTKMFGNKPGTSDPYVKLECDGSVFTTATKQKTTKPLWLEVVRIPVDPYSHAFLECSVFDKDLVGADDFMGKMKVPMDNGADGKRDKDRGRLEIYTIWRYTSTLKLEVPTELFVDGYPFIDERFPPTCLRSSWRGKGLQAVDVSLTGQATSSDPYVRVSCEGQVAQTSVKEKTLEPRWKEILTLGPVEDETSDLVLTVFDHDVASADDKMGEIRLPLALLANKAPVRRWLPLGGSIAPAASESSDDDDRGQSTRRGAMLKSKKKRRGGVVALGADRDAPAAQHHKPAHHDEHERLNLDGTRHQSSKDLAAQRPKVRHDHSPLDYVEFTHPDKRIGNIDVWVAWRHDPEFMYKLPPGSDADPFPGLEPNELTITVIRAKRLLAVDTSLLGGTSSSDPMVAIRLGAGPEQRTQSVKKNLYPAWQETFYLKDDKSGDDVDVVVYDVDAKVVSDETREFMGQCKVNLAKHRDFRGRCVRHWYPLVGEDGKADLDRGTLELFTAFRHNPDLAVVDVPEEHAVDPHIGTEDPNERSDVKEGTASPVWVDTYAFECDDWNADICFEVYDKNAIANRPDELLGTLTIPVKSLSSRKPLRKWCRLADKSGKPSKTCGDLDVCLHWRHSPKVKGFPYDFELDPPAPEHLQLNQLQIHVVRARGLQSAEHHGGGFLQQASSSRSLSKGGSARNFGSAASAKPAGSSEPQVKLQIGSLAPQRTKKVERTLNPDFDERVVFDDVYDPTLSVVCTVEDGAKSTTQPEFHGKVTVPIRILAHRLPLRKWFLLENKKGRADAALGRMELVFRWCYNRFLDVNLPEEGAIDDQVHESPNELFVVLIRARNLHVEDRKSRGDSCDPYAKLTCCGKMKKSSVRKKTLNPRWIERMAWDADDISDELVVEIHDTEVMGGHDFMGQCRISMEDLKKRQSLRRCCSSTGATTREMRGRTFPEDDPADPYPDKTCNALKIVLVRAKKLKMLDKYLFHRGGSTDPVCTIKFHDERRVSSTKKRDLNPEWGERFTFDDVDKLEEDHFEVLIEDVEAGGQRDVVGRVKIYTSSFQDRKPHRRWYWLEGEHDAQPRTSGKDETLVDEFVGVEEPNEVTVCVVRCRKLQRTSRTLALKDSSCPFVKVRTKFEEKKTRTLRATVHPQYMKRFAFEMRAGDDDLLVETWDGGERDGDDPLFMGARSAWKSNLQPDFNARIHLRALDDRVPHRMWLTLGDAKGKHDAAKGRGQVEVVAWHHYNPRHHCDVPGDARDDAVPDGPCNQICVSVLRAWNLTALDHKSASSGFAGSSDPFCVVHCNGQDKTTATIDADVHPVWLATFKFLASPKNDVRFDVWDYDSLRSNKFIGTAAFPLGDAPFEKGRPRRLWLKLTNRDGFKDKRRGMVEIFVHWHTSMKLYKEEEIDDVAHLTEDGSVEYAGGYRPKKKPKRPTGHAPEQLVVAVLKASGLKELALDTAERFHFDVEAWEGPGYWDGPNVTLSLHTARDASAAPDWAMALGSKTYKVAIFTLKDRRTITFDNGLAVDVFFHWRHLQDPQVFARPRKDGGDRGGVGGRARRRGALAPAKPSLAPGMSWTDTMRLGAGDTSTEATSTDVNTLSFLVDDRSMADTVEDKSLEGGRSFLVDDGSVDDAASSSFEESKDSAAPAPAAARRRRSSRHGRGQLVPASRAAHGMYDVATDAYDFDVEAVEVEVVVHGARGVPSTRFLSLDANANVAPSTPGQQRVIQRRFNQLPLQVLGFASLWIASPHGEPRRDRDWLPLCGGALSGDDWTQDRGELDVEIRVLGPADPARLAVKRPWSRHVPPTPPFAIDAPALRSCRRI
ncbi:C2 domain-containing protein [Aureococcus anophagefferens]|nr:C2 domain-containing protein [Aureococcus anophagefferens]